MLSIYYSAAWTERGCFISCSHEHETIVETNSCIPCAGGYVVGVENGVMRSLTAEEEAEFQRVHYAPRTDRPPVDAIAEAAVTDPRYAVMTPIWVVDHWSWATWMCFDTFAQAVAHARKGNKVVRFASEEWAALKQQEWAAQPQQTEATPPIRANKLRESLSARGEVETFVDRVLRLLDAYGLDLHAESISDAKSGSVDDSTSESNKQMSMIEPAFMARLILSRLSELEIGQLQRMCDDDIPALLNALQNRSHDCRQERT
jgi:hypothetical protein